MLGTEQRKWNNTSGNELELERPNGSSGEFEERLEKAIDESLALFGPIGKHRLCQRLKEVFDLEPGKMAADPERLSSALDQILGRAGRVIGRAIAHRVAATYSFELPQDRDLTYADHISNLKQMVSRDCTLSKRLGGSGLAHGWMKRRCRYGDQLFQSGPTEKM